MTSATSYVLRVAWPVTALAAILAVVLVVLGVRRDQGWAACLGVLLLAVSVARLALRAGVTA